MFGPAQRNPLGPPAITRDEVAPGVEFYALYHYDIDDPEGGCTPTVYACSGTFLSGARLELRHDQSWYADVMLECQGGVLGEMDLCSNGVAHYVGCPEWADAFVVHRKDWSAGCDTARTHFGSPIVPGGPAWFTRSR